MAKLVGLWAAPAPIALFREDASVIKPAISHRRVLAIFGVAAIVGLGADGRANAQDSPLHALAKQAGAATDVDPPPDFVLKSRPAEPPAPIPVFTTPDEPPSKALTPLQLKAMDADLDSASKAHDALRAGFAPSAKAMAEAEAARRAKQKKKRPSDATKPQT